MKNTLSPSDYFEIRKVSLISAKDYEYALDLYAPLIGIKNVSVYFAMVGEESNVLLKHAEFLTKFRLSSGEFEGALSYLEAVGLIASFHKESNGVHHYIYTVMAPRTPSQFFSNELLYGTLRSNISEEECQKISHKYMLDDVPSDYENISERFVDVFHPDFVNGTNIQSGPKTGERRFGSIALGFDNNAFAKALYEINPNIKSNYITRDEVKRIARIAALYNYEESAMASFVATSYRPGTPIGTRVNFDQLTDLAVENIKYEYLHKETLIPTQSEIHGSEPTAKVIRLMDNKSAIEFLTILQRGNKPAPSDIKLINTLVTDMGVPENVVNALIFYVLSVQENTLSNAYVTKLGGSLVRAGITNALDTLNYLGSKSEKAKAKKTNKETKTYTKPSKETKPTKQAEVMDEESEEDDEEFERFLNS